VRSTRSGAARSAKSLSAATLASCSRPHRQRSLPEGIDPSGAREERWLAMPTLSSKWQPRALVNRWKDLQGPTPIRLVIEHALGARLTATPLVLALVRPEIFRDQSAAVQGKGSSQDRPAPFRGDRCVRSPKRCWARPPRDGPHRTREGCKFRRLFVEEMARSHRARRDANSGPPSRPQSR